MIDIATIISITLLYSGPLIYVALGGVISENGGVVNIGLEGMMTIGALVGATVGYYSGNPWLAFLCGGLAGMGLSLLHAIATINFSADHIVSGIAINLIGPGLSLFLAKLFFDGATLTKPIPLDNKLPKIMGGLISKLPEGQFRQVIRIIFEQHVTVYLAFLLVLLTYFLLYKTKLGLRIRSVGEHPLAAETLGVNAYRVKYVCVLLSGFLSGLGGASMSLAVVSSFRDTLVSGQGFIALAAMIFGGWKPQGAMYACLLFGAAQGLSVFLGSKGFNVDPNLLSMLPYVITLLVLVAFVKGVRAPSADGKPYERSK